MKLNIKTSRRVEITFRNKNEHDMFMSMLNCSPICQVMGWFRADLPSATAACNGGHAHTHNIADALCDTHYIQTNFVKKKL